MDKSEYISASEMGDFTYCKRSWWLKRNGVLPTTAEMVQGIESHENIFQQLLRIKLIQHILVWVGIILLMVLITLLFFA